MQIKLVLPTLLLLFSGCEKENKLNEIPEKILILKPCTAITDSITGILPENPVGFNNDTAFFASTIQKEIILANESEVYVSFISEGAYYKNTLGWYSYRLSKPPLKASDIDRHVLFPNISKKGEGGELEPGYTLQLGADKFPAGTVIGFFLVLDGWKDGIIDYSNGVHYTNYEFNTGKAQQHILYKDANCNRIIIGFEDLPLELYSDNDFNDIVFSVSDNKDGLEITSFDLSNVIIR